MSKKRSNNSSSRSNDFFNNLLQTPIPGYSPPSGSSSAGQSGNFNAPSLGFAQYSSAAINPYSIPLDDPNRDFQIFMYNQARQFEKQPETPQSRNVQTSRRSPQPEPELKAEDEFIPETQPTGVRGKGKGKGVRVFWSDQECKILAERWIDASENPSIGNSQAASTFWQTVMRSYNSLVTPPRSMDQLTSKWTKLAREVKIFNSIYSKITGLWESGNGDSEIIANAREQYKLRYKKSFSYESAWRVLRECPKFFNPEGVTQRKRPIILEDDDSPIDLADDSTRNPNPDTINNLFSDDPLRRPIGRNTSRKSQKSSGSSDATSGRYSAEEAREEVVEAARVQKATMQTIAEEARKRTALANKRTMFKAFKFLATPIPTNLPPNELQMLTEARQQIVSEYGPRMQSRRTTDNESDSD